MKQHDFAKKYSFLKLTTINIVFCLFKKTLTFLFLKIFYERRKKLYFWKEVYKIIFVSYSDKWLKNQNI